MPVIETFSPLSQGAGAAGAFLQSAAQKKRDDATAALQQRAQASNEKYQQGTLDAQAADLAQRKTEFATTSGEQKAQDIFNDYIAKATLLMNQKAADLDNQLKALQIQQAKGALTQQQYDLALAKIELGIHAKYDPLEAKLELETKGALLAQTNAQTGLIGAETGQTNAETGLIGAQTSAVKAGLGTTGKPTKLTPDEAYQKLSKTSQAFISNLANKKLDQSAAEDAILNSTMPESDKRLIIDNGVIERFVDKKTPTNDEYQLLWNQADSKLKSALNPGSMLAVHDLIYQGASAADIQSMLTSISNNDDKAAALTKQTGITQPEAKAALILWSPSGP